MDPRPHQINTLVPGATSIRSARHVCTASSSYLYHWFHLYHRVAGSGKKVHLALSTWLLLRPPTSQLGPFHLFFLFLFFSFSSTLPPHIYSTSGRKSLSTQAVGTRGCPSVVLTTKAGREHNNSNPHSPPRLAPLSAARGFLRQTPPHSCPHCPHCQLSLPCLGWPSELASYWLGLALRCHQRPTPGTHSSPPLRCHYHYTPIDTRITPARLVWQRALVQPAPSNPAALLPPANRPTLWLLCISSLGCHLPHPSRQTSRSGPLSLAPPVRALVSALRPPSPRR